MKGIILMLVFLSSCSLNSQNFYQETNYPEKPAQGFNRFSLFPKYLSFFLGLFPPTSSSSSQMVESIKTRKNWNTANLHFKKAYSHFNVELVAVNNLPNNSFTWEERILFADALDIIVFAVNQPEFLQEMQKEELKKPFYNNERTKVISAEYVVKHIRSSAMYFYLGKSTLEKNVLAQATIGGFNHVIWFRNDVNYQQEYDVFSLAVVLFHELTHNLGYLHSSNVPYGIQQPFLRVINKVSIQKSQEFISLTPYYEDSFLTRVRVGQSNAMYKNSLHIQTDYVDDIGVQYSYQ